MSNQNSYGFPEGFTPVFPAPIIALRDPTSADIGYELGQQWINKSNNDAWILTSVNGTAAWGPITSGSSALTSLTGDSGGAISPVAGNITIAGGTNLTSVGTTGTITVNLDNSPSVSGTITAGTGITSTTGAITATAGAVVAGTTVTAGTGITATTGNITATAGAVNAGTSMTATLGNITATNGNFASSAAGKGLVLNSTAATGAAASPVVLNARSGQVIFSSVSIAAAADLTLTITNSEILSVNTQIIFSMSGATTGAALSVKSVTPGAGTVAFVVTNGTGATTTTEDIKITFLVVNGV